MGSGYSHYGGFGYYNWGKDYGREMERESRRKKIRKIKGSTATEEEIKWYFLLYLCIFCLKDDLFS
jgi:hypothetical protein